MDNIEIEKYFENLGITVNGNAILKEVQKDIEENGCVNLLECKIIDRLFLLEIDGHNIIDILERK